MPRYRVTAVNGRAWVTDDFEDVSDAKNVITAGRGDYVEDYVEFSALAAEEDRPGQLRVILRTSQVVSFEELPS